ncbi:hypothetical protein NPIL_474561 [Nephila pilipes]|uniref:Uncharacterized protein n=1 Tax=Nephila pilipes TaxID=299642 RepID=A0A8X6Q0C9_NEPPI|nr:hypothetical protein NPIL_474561 [Nephila pilipes]
MRWAGKRTLGLLSPRPKYLCNVFLDHSRLMIMIPTMQGSYNEEHVRPGNVSDTSADIHTCYSQQFYTRSADQFNVSEFVHHLPQ